ncbi:MAG: sigma-70 family RNA polymerase sigma factor [Chloroflexi bacterium]|nr:sigma-70 family RNA polymerase sigma factor [Chloroflexota bacterium]
MDESRLLQGARAFDPGCLAELYDRYSPEIYAYAWRLLGDVHLAEDCTAETFTRLLSALRSGGGPSDHLRAYLYRTAHNIATDHYRRHPPADLSEDLSSADPPPEALAGLAQRQRQMRAALLRLTPEQRQVILLRFYQELDPAETAAALGRPTGAVKSLQHRALAALRRLLNQEDIE